MGAGESSELKKKRLATIVACVINNPGIGTGDIRQRLGIAPARFVKDSAALGTLGLIRFDRKRRGWVPGAKA